jgi:rhomboid protease GluP
MTLRELAREFKDYPATTVFCFLWIVVFVVMIVTQINDGVYPSLSRWLVVGIGEGRQFGDLSLRDLARGEYWRLITSTFVHFSLLHLGLNVLAMYQLGTMTESWFGKSQLVFIYGLTGGGGNLISAILRYAAGSNPRIHSGGGSVVIMGLVGLWAVAGLRSGTGTGKSLGRLMFVFIFMTALLGIALPQYIDNWGHAGGALVGVTLGFGHRGLLRAASRPSTWGRGVFMGVVIAACLAAQLVEERLEAPIRRERNVIRRLAALETSYRQLSRIAGDVSQRGNATIAIKSLASERLAADSERLPPADARKLRSLAKAASAGPLPAQESGELTELFTTLLERVRRDYAAEREKLWQLRRDPNLRRTPRSSTATRRVGAARYRQPLPPPLLRTLEPS